jgi:hypothetical protein
MKILYALKAYFHRTDLVRPEEFAEAIALVRAMYEWTGHKDTPWAARAEKLLRRRTR